MVDGFNCQMAISQSLAMGLRAPNFIELQNYRCVINFVVVTKWRQDIEDMIVKSCSECEGTTILGFSLVTDGTTGIIDLQLCFYYFSSSLFNL